jgi:hypothetical protein
MLFKRFMSPPMVAVPPRGAIKDGIDQATAAASPLSPIESRKITRCGASLIRADWCSRMKESFVAR